MLARGTAQARRGENPEILDAVIVGLCILYGADFADIVQYALDCLIRMRALRSGSVSNNVFGL